MCLAYNTETKRVSRRVYTRWFKTLVIILLGWLFGVENENIFSQIRHHFRVATFYVDVAL
jgi:hypothetical protein